MLNLFDSVSVCHFPRVSLAADNVDSSWAVPDTLIYNTQDNQTKEKGRGEFPRLPNKTTVDKLVDQCCIVENTSQMNVSMATFAQSTHLQS